MMEKVGLANIFPPFWWFQRLPHKFVEKVEKVRLANIFHDSSRFGGLNRGKCWPGHLFPPFSWFTKLPPKWLDSWQGVVFSTVIDGNGKPVNHFHEFWWLEASKPSEATVPEPWKLWKLLVLPTVSMIFATKFTETMSKANNFHNFWWLEASKPSEAIVPEIMEIVGFTNNFHDFCYQTHGNYWFQGRKHSKNLGQWGGTIRIYIYIYASWST